jgi:hypothetical protein
MMVSRFATMLIADPDIEVPQRLIMTVNSGDVVQFQIERQTNCPFCLEKYPEVIGKLLNEQII